MSYWNSPTFKSLQRTWYRRLEADGFQDAEEMIGSELMLRQSATHPYRHTDELGIETKEAYYNFLSQQASEFQFHNDIDRVILTMFAEGAKIKRISEALEKRGQPRCRWTIRYRIRAYEMKWGLREYTPRQLGKKVS